MQFHCENICVFKDSGFLIVVALAHHLITRSLEKGLKIGVQDVPRRFQTTLPSHLRLGSASVTGLEGFWSPK